MLNYTINVLFINLLVNKINIFIIVNCTYLYLINVLNVIIMIREYNEQYKISAVKVGIIHYT